MSQLPEPSVRKPLGVFLIIALIIIWCVGIVSLSTIVSSWLWPIQAAFYLLAGIGWILPLRPLLLWMETGRFR